MEKKVNPKVLYIIFLLMIMLNFGMAGYYFTLSSKEVTINKILAEPNKYDKQTVAGIWGSVSSLKQKENKGSHFYIFELSARGGKLSVLARDNAELKNGSHVQVTGTYYKEKQVGQDKFFNLIEASQIRVVSAKRSSSSSKRQVNTPCNVITLMFLFIIVVYSVGFSFLRSSHEDNLFLHDATIKGEKERAEQLIRAGSDVNARDFLQDIPLHYAVLSGQQELIGLLLAKGSDINASNILGWTPLNLAVLKGNKELVKLLLEKGAMAYKKDVFGLTPLKWATFLGNKEIADMVRNYGGW